MDFLHAVGWAKGHRNALVVAALVFVLAGADIVVNRPKDPDVFWLSVPLLAAGFAILALILWPTARPGPRPPGDSLASRLLHRVTLGGRLVPLFPLFGIAIVVADLAYNAYVAATPDLQMHDLITLLLGGTLIAYRFVPARYARERDFVVLFASILSLVLVLPLLLARTLYGDSSSSVDVYSSIALAPQTSVILNALGVQNGIVYTAALTAPGLAFRTAAGVDVTVFITSSCSGIYSFAIFASAFAAFVLTEQKRLTRRVALFFALGILLAYVANVLRMVVIVLVGYHYDTPETGLQNMLAAHSNAGWMIFLVWVGAFWAVLFRFLPPDASPKAEEPAAPRARRGVFCGICQVVLTPAIPATRCECGKFYHLECLTAEGKCPNCSAPSTLSYPAVDHAVP